MFKKLFLLIIYFPFVLQSGIIEHEFGIYNVPINFTVEFSVPKFDSSIGDLSKIEFQLTGRYTGASRTENLSLNPVTITLDNRVHFQQGISGGSMLFDEYILTQNIFNADGWDGSFPPDWMGMSGKEFIFNDERIETFILEKSDIASLSLFTGLGSVSIPVTVKDVSTVSMSGSNIVASQFENLKSVQSLVRYHYAPIPESGIYGYIGILICGVIILYKRRKKK